GGTGREGRQFVPSLIAIWHWGSHPLPLLAHHCKHKRWHQGRRETSRAISLRPLTFYEGPARLSHCRHLTPSSKSMVSWSNLSYCRRLLVIASLSKTRFSNAPAVSLEKPFSLDGPWSSAESSFTIAVISGSAFHRSALDFRIRYVRMHPRAKSFTPSQSSVRYACASK